MRKPGKRTRSQDPRLHAWDSSPGLRLAVTSANRWNASWIFCDQKVLSPCAIQKPASILLKRKRNMRHAWRHCNKSTRSISLSLCKHMTLTKAYRPSWRNANQIGKICKPGKQYGRKSTMEDTLVSTDYRHTLSQSTSRASSCTRWADHPGLLHHRESRLGRRCPTY